MEPVDVFEDLQQAYRDFAREEAPLSVCYSTWAEAVAEDAEVLELLGTSQLLVISAQRW